MIIYSCENCCQLFWTKTALSQHHSKHIKEDDIKIHELIWRRLEIKVINKSSLQHGIGFNKCIPKYKLAGSKLI